MLDTIIATPIVYKLYFETNLTGNGKIQVLTIIQNVVFSISLECIYQPIGWFPCHCNQSIIYKGIHYKLIHLHIGLFYNCRDDRGYYLGGCNVYNYNLLKRWWLFQLMTHFFVITYTFFNSLPRFCFVQHTWIYSCHNT